MSDLNPDADFQKSMLNSAAQDDDAVGLGSVNTMHVDEVLDLARRSRTRELPGNYPFSVIKNLVNQSTQRWESIADACFQEVERLVTKHIQLLIDQHFGPYSSGGLKADVTRVATLQIRERARLATARIDSLLQCESQPFTQNEEFFLSYRTRLLRRYKIIHRQSRGEDTIVKALNLHNPSSSLGVDSNSWQYINNVLTNLSYLGISGLQAKDLARVLPDDDMDPALGIMAEVRAYFQVAYKRFCDNVPQQIDADFVQGLEEGFDLALMTLDLSEEQCREYLREPAHIYQKRRELNGRKRRLDSASSKLTRYYRERQVREYDTGDRQDADDGGDDSLFGDGGAARGLGRNPLALDSPRSAISPLFNEEDLERRSDFD